MYFEFEILCKSCVRTKPEVRINRVSLTHFYCVVVVVGKICSANRLMQSRTGTHWISKLHYCLWGGLENAKRMV